MLRNDALISMERTLEISSESAQSSQASIGGEFAKTPNEQENKAFGFCFPAPVPWRFLAIEYRVEGEAATGQSALVGDGEEDCGFFSWHAFIAPNALEQMREVAVMEDGRIIRKAPASLLDERVLMDSYTVTLGSVVRAPESSTGRHNDLIIVFNVLHQLTPTEVHICMETAFRNTTSGGVAIFVMETPFTSTVRKRTRLDYDKKNK